MNFLVRLKSSWVFSRRWVASARKMRSFVRALELDEGGRSSNAPYAVLVSNWVGTEVPWFSIACGMFLARDGQEVVFVFDDLPFGREDWRTKLIRRCIASVLAVVGERRRVVRLSGMVRPTANSIAQRVASVKSLSELNGTWRLRGETLQEGRTSYVQCVMQQLAVTHCVIEQVLALECFRAILVPGGIYGNSGLWMSLGREAGARVASFDSFDPRGVMLAADGVAAHLADIPKAMELMKARPSFDRERGAILGMARAEMARRRAGTDKFSSQIPGTTSLVVGPDKAVLIALNSPWDTSALGLHDVFETSVQWVVESVRWLLERSSSRIIVRQHPAERFAIARSTDDLGEVLKEAFGNDTRLQFVGARDPVNTYDLLDGVDVVLVYTSTLGVEAGALGKKVLTCSRGYYSSMAFVESASSKEQYFRTLGEALDGKLHVDAREDALICYYLAQCCNPVFTEFAPEGFENWIRIPPEQLADSDGVGIVVRCIGENIPAAVLNHERVMREGGKAGSKDDALSTGDTPAGYQGSERREGNPP